MKMIYFFLFFALAVPSFTQASIPLSSSFQENSPLPLDAREQFADITARDAIPAGQRWQGMRAFTIATQQLFILKPA